MAKDPSPTGEFHIYHHSLRHVPGAINWYGEDYTSFTYALDSTVHRLKIMPLKQPLAVHVHLNDENISEEQIVEWKDSYCAEKKQEYKSEYILMQRQGLNFLFKGLGILWISLTFVYFIDQWKFLGTYTQMLGRETFYFLGWVILWKPIEMIVFEPWALKHQLRLIDKLDKTTFTTLPS